MIRRNTSHRITRRPLAESRTRMSRRFKENALDTDEVWVKLTVEQLREVLDNTKIDPEEISVKDIDGNKIYDVYSLVWDAD